uniref:Uncharacterized protein n=1 Tax=Nelumbo nucifera TaxID=4432 RepID=A0A822XG34_NELNU|nr:TPA_asm: hypothetical protein HUJ06_019422 [Nelumbo nucifera]
MPRESSMCSSKLHSLLLLEICCLFILNSVVIPTLQWISPDECQNFGSKDLCPLGGIVKLYSFLRNGLIQLFYVSMHCFSKSYLSHFMIYLIFLFTIHGMCTWQCVFVGPIGYNQNLFQNCISTNQSTV